MIDKKNENQNDIEIDTKKDRKRCVKCTYNFFFNTEEE